MQKVYESSTAHEAHIVRILLESNGIQSTVIGDYLTVGAGTLPAIDLVRVMVEDTDFISASEILDKWESENIVSSRQDKPRVKSSLNGLMGFVAGVTITSAGFYWFYNTPVTVDGIDFDADGVLDEKWIFKNNVVRQSTHDRNRDGMVDQIYYFGTSGIINSAEIDYNFDGFFETEQTYRQGNIVTEISDSNQNGFPEYRISYKFGAIDTVDIFDEKTRMLRKRQQFYIGRLESAQYDSTGDGNLNITSPLSR